MRLTHFSFFSAIFLLCCRISYAETTTTTTTTTTTALVTQTVVETQIKTQWTPLKICVLDFMTIDTLGQERFLSHQNKKLSIPPQCTLNADDRKSIDACMQGYVRMIDATDISKTNDGNREIQSSNNSFDRAKALDLYNRAVNAEHRPMVIGAQYLTAYLCKHNDVFFSIPSTVMAVTMKKLQTAPDFPKDFMLKLAKETGATHLIYGIVSDIRTTSNSFKGYGIETKTLNYQLDVIIKVVDLAAQQCVYSNVYTGTYQERKSIAEKQMNDNIFHALMTSALEQAAEELHDICKPGRKNKIRVTPIPCLLTVNTIIGDNKKSPKAEIYIDGNFVGQNQEQFLVAPGQHTLEIKCEKFKNKFMSINITADKTITIQLDK